VYPVPAAVHTCVSELALVVLQPIVKLCPATIVVCDALTVGFGVVATGLTVV
jgi:hypothetical protein